MGVFEPFGLPGQVARLFALANLSMGVFNLLPAYPMDGGRVLRSVLAKFMGWMPASRLAIRVGRGFAWAFLAYGVARQEIGVLMTGIFLHVTLQNEQERLVALHWERTTGQPAPWAQGGDEPVPRLR